MDVIERSKALFKGRLEEQDPELVAEVETWDDYHQNFFWAYAYKRFQQILDEKIIETILYGNGSTKVAVGLADEPSPTPFLDSERLLKPGKWFSNGNCRLINRT